MSFSGKGFYKATGIDSNETVVMGDVNGEFSFQVDGVFDTATLLFEGSVNDGVSYLPITDLSFTDKALDNFKFRGVNS